MSDACVFCRVLRGELPSTRIYEDDEIVALMDIGPLVRGHALVIPRAHVDPLTAVPAALLGRLMAVVQKVAAAQLAGLKADGVNVHQSNGAVAGQVVPHVHFHVVPRFAGDGHSWNWRPRKYETPAEMQTVADAIRKAMG